MSVAKSSPLLKVLGIIFGLIFMVLLLNLFSGEEDTAVQSGDALSSVPEVKGGDYDEQKEVISTLTAEVTGLSRRLEELSQENQRLRDQAADTRRAFEDQLQSAIANQSKEQQEAFLKELEATKTNQRSLIEDLSDKIDQKLTIDGLSQKPSDGQLPIGGGTYGPDGEPIAIDTGDQIEWVTPLGVGAEGEGGGQILLPEGSANEPFETDLGFEDTPEAEPAEEPEVRSVHTIPENSTLLDSVAMTALIGRVPFKGSVSDPLRFKILVGAENLASNGITIPNVVGMVASGVAIGDWTLSCVRGTIDSLTFTFEDGTIHTVSERSSGSFSSGGGAADGGTGERIGVAEGLGSISDPFGVPCIAGERISNASSFLFGRVLTAGIEGLSGALAKSETTEEPSNNAFGGDNATNITGDAGRFAFFETLKGASEELGEYFKERQAQTFDAIFVKPGHRVAVHIQREIPIDFNRAGRKVFHGNATSDPSVSANLD